MQNELFKPYQKIEYRVLIDGNEVAYTDYPRINRSLSSIAARCDVQVAEWPDGADIGSSVDVDVRINGSEWFDLFFGHLYIPSLSDFPPVYTISALDPLDKAKLGPRETISLQNVTDGQAVMMLLEEVNITNHNLIDRGWLLGTNYAIDVLPSTSVASMIQAIDKVTGFRTWADATGTVIRAPFSYVPSELSAAVARYAGHDAVQPQMGVVSASLSGQSTDAIFNRIELAGATLRTPLNQVESEELTIFYELWSDLSQEVAEDSISVTSNEEDPSDRTTYLVDVDYIVDYSRPGIQALTDGNITDGQFVIVGFEYEAYQAAETISAIASGSNPYLPAYTDGSSPFQVLSFQSELIQDFITADEVVSRLIFENNRLARELSLNLSLNPFLNAGFTIGYKDNYLRLFEEQPFQIVSLTHNGLTTSLTAKSGEGGAGYLAPRAPVANFTVLVKRIGPLGRVACNGSSSYDPDGNLAPSGFFWWDDQGNSMPGTAFVNFDYDTNAVTSVSISLQVVDLTGLQSQVITRVIELSDANYMSEVFVIHHWEWYIPDGDGEGEGFTDTYLFRGRYMGELAIESIDLNPYRPDGIIQSRSMVPVASPSKYYNPDRIIVRQNLNALQLAYAERNEEDPDLPWGGDGALGVFGVHEFLGELDLNFQLTRGWVYQRPISNLTMIAGEKVIDDVPHVVVVLLELLDDAGSINVLREAVFGAHDNLPGEGYMTSWAGYQSPSDEHVYHLDVAWYNESETVLRVCSVRNVYESLDGGATWTSIIDHTIFPAVTQIDHPDESFWIGYQPQFKGFACTENSWIVYSDVPKVPAIYTHDEQWLTLEGYGPIAIFHVAPSLADDVYIINQFWLLRYSAGAWTIKSIEYIGGPPSTGLPELTISEALIGNECPIWHPDDQDLIALARSEWPAQGFSLYRIEEGNDAVVARHLASQTKTSLGEDSRIEESWFPYVGIDETGAHYPGRTGHYLAYFQPVNLSLSAYQIAPVAPLSEYSSTETRVLRNDAAPEDWLQLTYDDGSWGHAFLVI